MKYLNVDDLLDAANDCGLKNIDKHIRALEKAAQALADDLAKHLDIECGNAEHLSGFGGLCASFSPKHKGQECPNCIEDKDEGGEWDDSPDEEDK